MHELLPLTALVAGQVAEVRRVVGRPEQVQRLEELGVRDGVVLEMVRPGTPCIVRVGASKLCLRDGELLSLLVALRKSA
jgi:ferrous iron transport protein A